MSLNLYQIIRLVLSDIPSTSTDFINASDMCLTLCMSRREETILSMVFDIFCDFIKETKQELSNRKLVCSFVESNPLTALTRDVNSIIVKMLQDDVTSYAQQRRKLYKKAASIVHRMLSYLSRYFLPNCAAEGLIFNHRGTKYQYLPRLDSMLLNIDV